MQTVLIVAADKMLRLLFLVTILVNNFTNHDVYTSICSKKYTISTRSILQNVIFNHLRKKIIVYNIGNYLVRSP